MRPTWKSSDIAFLRAASCLLVFAALGLLPAGAQKAPSSGPHGIVATNLDRSVRPGDNFYRYTNGSWLDRTDIPPDRSSVGVDTVRRQAAQLADDRRQLGQDR